jgi:hypothetical protein
MKRTQHLWLIGLGIVVCLACMMGSFFHTSVQAQTSVPNDDNLFTVYTHISRDGSGHISAYSYLVDDDPINEADILSETVNWDLFSDSYDVGGVGDNFSGVSVPLGDSYTVNFYYDLQYMPFSPDNCSDSNCSPQYDSPFGYADIYVPYPAATVTNISPSNWIAGQSYPGVQITGTNFGSAPTVTLSDSTIQINRQAYSTSTSGSTSTTSIDIYVPPGTPSEPVTVTVIPGSSGSSFVSGTGGSLSGSSTADVIGAQQNACPSDTDATSGFSSITPSGLAVGGSGSMTVSFSHGSYSGFGVTVPYGPYSTPASIASHMAALITKQYANSGLTAQAYGANILYTSRATLGNPSIPPSASFTANASPQSCPPASIHLRLVPVVSQNELQANGTTHLLHNVWRLVTLDGQRALPISYTISEHTSISRGNYIDTVYPGWYTSSDSPNIFDDKIGCQGSGGLCDNTIFMQKFTISSSNGSNVPVMILIPNQVPRWVMTIHDHGTALPTMNDDKGPIYPVFSPNQYNDPIPYPCANNPCTIIPPQ